MRTVVLCPFTAGTVLWQAQSGAWTLTAVVRGTFSLVHGREAVLADAQEAPSDLAPYKPRAEVVLVGSAHAPDGQPVDALVARVAIGSVDKAIGVIGDRTWIEGPDGLEPSLPQPFRTMPLGPERAARARDNPQGFDLTRPPRLGALALPNLEAADDEIRAGRSVGFGPVAPAASTRRGLLRAEGWAWVQGLEGGGQGPAPEGLDFGFFNAAPPDQQLDALHGGEPLVLENLARERARFETRLPDVRGKAFLVSPEMDRGAEVPLRCDTLWIDTDRGLLTLTWRGVVSVPEHAGTPDEDALGTLVVAAESKGREVRWEQIQKLLRDGGMTSSSDGDTFTGPRIALLRDTDLDLAPTPGKMVPKRALPSTEATPSPTAKVPVPGPTPVVIEAQEPAAPPSMEEELTGSDFLDSVPPPAPESEEDLKTKTRMLVPRDDDPDELKTKTRMLVPREDDTDAQTKTQTRVDLPIRDEIADEPSTHRIQVRRAAPATLRALDYALIAVAAERGEAAGALDLYGLGVPDLPRITKEWRERSLVDRGFAEAFARAVAEARRG